MKVRIYFNLHKHVFSVQHKTPKGWRILGHTDAIALKDARFIVSEAGRKRVLREKRKNVHAYIEGELVKPFTSKSQVRVELEGITYNPYVCGNFMFRDRGVIVDSSPLVIGTVSAGRPCLFAMDPHDSIV